MAKPAAEPGKLSKEEKKALKAAQKVEKRERRKQIWEAFKLQRKSDKWLIPWMLLALLGTAAVLVGFGLLVSPSWWYIYLVLGLLLGAMIAMIIFSRRVQKSVYKQAEGTPGAAAWSLQNNLRGRWRITPAIAGTAQLDAVHRVIGRPGVILVGEGVPHRVKPLLAQEKKRIAKVVGSTPIYDVIVGNDEGQVPLRKLNTYLTKLPRNITANAVGDLDSRLNALGSRSPQAGMPKGPMPSGAKMRNVQRAARRR